VVDCGGRYLMPGLIDAHFHSYSPTFDIGAADRMPASLMASHAARILEGALERGFTTVRDAGGGDIGLFLAIEQGLIRGPRLFFAGRALSQTGGHGDIRRAEEVQPCGCHGYSGVLTRVVDGVDEVRRAVREELRKGAHQIKLFVSGGVLSPTDPLWMPQFTAEEIRAAVEEAGTRRTYVMAHCHTDEGAARCVELGVRSVEHGTLINRDETARIIARRGSFVVPTLSVIDVLQQHAAAARIAAESLQKVKSIGDEAYRAIEVCRRAGVKLGLGTDLLGHAFHPAQGGELELRGRVEKPIDVLRSATSVNAELLQKSGELGQITPGACADILVLDSDPFRDLALFRDPGKIPVVMKGGAFIRNVL
ncbi:MAG TPA: amidohydrolase family protein, partial [Steroidobacteraceae bacterium]|nr:amidohydrolase family protein [Steroidobacteraceae bacterium]